MNPARIACLFAALFTCITAAPALAGAERQDTTAIQRAVENFVRRETAGLPGQVKFDVGAIEPRLNLAPCPALETFVPPGARLWGGGSVGVRCLGANPWTIYVPVAVHVQAQYVVAARPLVQGQVVAVEDLVMRDGDLAQLPAGIVTDRGFATGKTIAVSIASGQPLRQDMLRAPLVIQQGQTVKLASRGHGFRVTSEGRAINNAADGQIAQVRTATGQVVSGVARGGAVVEIAY